MTSDDGGNQIQLPPTEHSLWADRGQLMTEDTVQRWFTAVLNRIMTAGMRGHGRHVQE